MSHKRNKMTDELYDDSALLELANDQQTVSADVQETVDNEHFNEGQETVSSAFVRETVELMEDSEKKRKSRAIIHVNFNGDYPKVRKNASVLGVSKESLVRVAYVHFIQMSKAEMLATLEKYKAYVDDVKEDTDDIER